jgi:drug/metabolite transporter (DMT)-like permease
MNNIVLFTLTLICWSPTWYLIKFQLGYVDPLISVFYRFILAAFIIFTFLIIKKKNLKFSLNHHLWFLIFGFCLYSINYVFFYLSNSYLISAFPAIVFSTSVIMNILGEWFYFKKKPTGKTLLGALIGMIGIFIIFNDEILGFTFANNRHIGLFFALIATLAASSGNMVHQRNLNHKFPLVAFLLYLKLLGNIGAGRSSYVGVLMPVIALLISTVFENLQWQLDLIIGLPFLLIGAILVIHQKIKILV